MTRPLENGILTRNWEPMRKKVCSCDRCEEEIYEGDPLFRFENMQFCSSNCGKDWFEDAMQEEVAEKPEPYLEDR